MEFCIAHELHMTVAALRDEMPNDEFLRWAVYLARKGQQAQLWTR